MEIPIVEKEVQSHQSHYKVSHTSPRPPFWPGAPCPWHPLPAFPRAHPLAVIQMTLAPNYRLSPEDGKVVKIRKNRNAESAVTRYRLLASSSACSLLELQPITGEAWLELCRLLDPLPVRLRSQAQRWKRELVFRHD